MAQHLERPQELHIEVALHFATVELLEAKAEKIRLQVEKIAKLERTFEEMGGGVSNMVDEGVPEEEQTSGQTGFKLGIVETQAESDEDDDLMSLGD